MLEFILPRDTKNYNAEADEHISGVLKYYIHERFYNFIWTEYLEVFGLVLCLQPTFVYLCIAFM